MPRFLYHSPLLLALVAAGCSLLSGGDEAATDRNVVRSGDQVCTYLDRENLYHPLYACETPSSYDLAIVDRQHRYVKTQWQSAMRSELLRFADHKPAYARALYYAVIDVWLAAPAFRPDRAYLVAWVKAPGVVFGVRLTIDPDSWDFKDAALTYPPQQGDGYKAKVFSFRFDPL